MSGSEIIFLIVVGVIYFLWTLSFSIYFGKVANRYFGKRIIFIHRILIWVIPIIWIVILKKLIRYRQRRQPENYGIIDNYGGYNFFFTLHGPSDLSGSDGPGNDDYSDDGSSDSSDSSDSD